MTVAERFKALRAAIKRPDGRPMSQEQVAEASGGGITRPEVVKVESGVNKLTSYEKRAAVAQAFGLPVDALSLYLDAKIGIEELLSRRAESAVRTPQQVHYTPRYLNATLALKQLQEEDVEIPADVAEDVVEGVRLASEEDPPVRFWRASFQQQLKLRTTYRDATLEQIRKHLGGVAVPSEDVATPKRTRR